MSLGDNVVQAARRALDEAMKADERIYVLGEDVVAGGPFTLTRGLADSYGTRRVLNTPICEYSFMGAGIGIALGGGRPFIDLMFDDFITVASDQLFNNAAKISFMSGGRYSVPLVVWTIAGAGTRWGAHHSQHLEGWLAQVPGLKVLAPSSPAMAGASVTAAFQESDPVVVVADRSLLQSRDVLPGDDRSPSPWSPRIVRPGDDVTLLTSGRLVHLALEAVRDLEISVEVIDLQALAPLDLDPVLASLERTSRLAILHDEAAPGGLSSMLARAIYDAGFWHLDAPISVLVSPGTPVPAAATLEDAYMISAEDIVRAVRDLVT
jgi:pyruvate/2-oxoglutarate/acetoin dehydrogenase E1 component